MPNRILPPDDEVKALYESGLSTGEIAKRCGCQASAVWKCLRRQGISMRTSAEANRKLWAEGKRKASKFWLGKKQSAEMVERRVSKIRGVHHYLWKGGLERRAYRDKMVKEVCARCGIRENLGIHHQDFDHYNDKVENLQVLCVSCHMSVHKKAWWDAKKAGLPYFSNAPQGR